MNDFPRWVVPLSALEYEGDETPMVVCLASDAEAAITAAEQAAAIRAVAEYSSGNGLREQEARADEFAIATGMALDATRDAYEQGQRDEREKWEPMVQALTDELLTKAQSDVSMGAQYLAGVAVGQRDEREACIATVEAHIRADLTEQAMFCGRKSDLIAAIRAREEKR